MVQTLRGNALRSLLERIGAHAAFSYASIFLIQLKIIWRIWDGRDVAWGDTLSYFAMAKLWHEHGRLVFTWSPLYTTFYGALLNLSPDGATVTMAHRMVIVLVLPLLVLAVARRLLSPLAAWAVGVWWCILPINFNATYEVHLFVVIPILGAYIVLAWIRGPWGRGVALALLILTTVLMRNEMLIPAAIFAMGCLQYELRRRKETVQLTRLSAAYAVPCALSLCLCVAFYARAVDQGPAMWQSLRSKHTLNICQVYAYGYQQRHPEWTLSAWIDCQKLMQATFGAPEPSLVEATLRNPKAIAEHVAWNFLLAPAGLQALLFSCMSGHVSPDYMPLRRSPWIAGLCSTAVLALWIAGGTLLWRRRKNLYAMSSQPVRWTWFALCAVASTSIAIIATQRPRPEYLYPLSILLMILTVRCAEELIGPARLASMQMALPVIAMAALLLAPSPFTWFLSAPRPLHDLYETLRPFGDRVAAGEVLVTPFHSEDLKSLLCDFGQPCKAVDFNATWNQADGKTVAQYLSEHDAGLFLVDERMYADPDVADFLTHADVLGWKTLSLEAEKTGCRVLLESPDVAKPLLQSKNLK